jgi:NTE family protein
MDRQPVDLVFEGGGVKGIGLAGAFSELWDRGYGPRCVAGTSAGAITAALVAAGYTGQELVKAVEEMPFERFSDEPRLHLLGPVAEAAELLSKRGLHSGNFFLEWMREMLAAKDKRTFRDLRNPAEPDNPKQQHLLQVVASDLTEHSMLVLPRDAQLLGIHPDDLEIALAVRMSMSIPIFFDAVIQPGADGRKHMIVDGGMLSNFPIWLFDAPPGREPRVPTFGMLLVAPNQKDSLVPQPPQATKHDDGMPSPIGYVKALADTMMQAHDRMYVQQADYARTITIPTCGVATTDFAIQAPKVQELLNSGRTAADQFLQTWDFQKYIARFRGDAEPPTRRATALG